MLVARSITTLVKCVSISILIQAILLCELAFMTITSFRIILADSNVPWLRLVKPLVLLHLLVCLCQTALVSIIYWTTPVKLPFLLAVVVLVITDILLLWLYNFIKKHYGRAKTRKVSTLFNHVR